MTFVAEAHNTVTNNGVDIVLPAGLQGGDVLVASISSLDTTIQAPVGWNMEKQQVVGTNLLHSVWTKVAAGTVGSGSSEAGTTVTFNVAISGAGHKSGVAVTAWRGISVSSPVNDSDMNSTTSSVQSFTGPGGTAAVDGVTVLSCFADKDSSNPFTITIPAGVGYTQRSAALFTSGSGKANTVIASKDGGAIGTYGAEGPWTTDAIPGGMSIITILLAPSSTVQVSRPASDVGTPTGVTGVPTNTAGSLYTNLDEAGAANLTDWVEFTLSGDLATNGTAINDPGTTSGFKVGAVLGLGAGASSATFHYKLMKSSTVVDEWDWTVTVDNTAFTRDIDPSLIAAHVTYTSGTVTLKLDRALTAVS